jgi:hypothetical protein
MTALQTNSVAAQAALVVAQRDTSKGAQSHCNNTSQTHVARCATQASTHFPCKAAAAAELTAAAMFGFIDT